MLHLFNSFLLSTCKLQIFSLLILQGCLSHNNHIILVSPPNTQAEIPFEVVSEVIILKAKVNGVTGRFLFDNGFSQSALDPDFGARAGLKFDGESNLTDFNNIRRSNPFTHVDTSSIGGFQFLNAKFYAVQTNALFPCDTIHGIIGGNIINQINWQIDWKNQIIRISTEPYIHPGIPVKISFNKNYETFTKLSVAKGAPISCKIDFGSNTALKLRYDDVIHDMKGVSVEIRTGIRSISAHGLGPVQTSYQTAEPISIHQDEHQLLSTPATITHELKHSAFLGAPFFKNYLVTINSTLKQYILSPYQNRTPHESRSTYGVALYFHDGKWKIIHKNAVDPYLKEISVWDEVIEIDQVSANQYPDICSWREYLKKKKKSGDPLHLLLAGQSMPHIVPYQPPILATLP